MNKNSNNYQLFDENLEIRNEYLARICTQCKKYDRFCKGRKTFRGVEIEFCPNMEKIKKKS
ncbi:hypothetical protein [Ilyobacter sp.]|jgi:hypothetical protein|uniref:hypothetical protein n=1 Tax=Ilyobacter sp. TaxID=3100343 RepID=UPI003564EEBF